MSRRMIKGKSTTGTRKMHRHEIISCLAMLSLILLLMVLASGCGGNGSGSENAANTDAVEIVSDENGFYSYDGYIIKADYPMDEASLEKAAGKMANIYEQFLEGENINTYFAIVPDKNAYATEAEGNKALQIMDYAALTEKMKSQTEFAKYIEIADLLELSDYYKTDAHWRQEKIGDVAARIAEAMGNELKAEYEEVRAKEDFVGAYSRQTELEMQTEPFVYLDSPIFEGCTITDFETNTEIQLYDETKLTGTEGEGYDMFLGGSKSLLTIENPVADADKELIIFRDSFGSSIAPLFAESYGKITLVDIRYLPSATLDRFIEFQDGQDVLFLFSTPVLNNSVTMK